MFWPIKAGDLNAKNNFIGWDPNSNFEISFGGEVNVDENKQINLF
jgi:hypothetical protein